MGVNPENGLPQSAALVSRMLRPSGDTTGVIDSATVNSILGTPGNYWLGPGNWYFGSQLVVAANGINLWCYGATINPVWSGVGNRPLFTGVGTNTLSQTSIRGGLWQGTGAETSQQVIFGLTGAVGGAGAAIQRSAFFDFDVSNWVTGLLYLANPYRVWVHDIRGDTVCANGGYNAINFVEVDDSAQVGKVWATSIDLQSCAAGSVAYVKSGGAATRDVQAILADINATGTSATTNSLNGGIDIEAVAGSTLLGILIDNFHVNSVAANSWAVNIGNSGQGTIHAKIKGGRIEGGAGSVGVHIGATASTADVQGNTILTPNKYGGNGTPNNRGNRYVEGSVMRGRATLVAGTVTVNTTEVVAGDSIIINRVTGTNMGTLTFSIVAGTSFTVTSNNAADTSTFDWWIEH